MKTNEVMDVALKAGEILLKSGAEIYRVEDTVHRISNSYNVKAEVFALPTGIFITVIGSDGEPVSFIRRIKERSVNLKRIEMINSFSRDLQKKTILYNDAVNILSQIQIEKGSGFTAGLIAAGATAFAFSLLFKGSIYDSIASFFISMLIFISKEKLSHAGVFHFFDYFASGIVAAGVSLLIKQVFPFLDIYKIIIASIIILLPGVAITNALKDALYGDIVSSQFRFAEAIFIAVAVGTGVAITLSVGLRCFAF